ncbi:hypothetical protein MKS83_17355 [Chryseobacterium sp. Y16C]|uniref:ComEC/Rec2 family competence protein n=1 Tax=Chryseobacterium sp. Y16C TaxID=2920939 RepID=UPI001F0B57C5|nr:hypothetical protein [Chryseobacterium sp. Y16C]UMQ41157.1 hypothetical protein MKS83_17355 [Chryseobacterium sp. Y16C]
MKITFKDVGQGDSIIIEWNNETKKIGIIDSKKIGNHNPVLEHIKNHNYKEIEFIVLSHPHTDHYSGLAEVFEYCYSNSVTIKKFCYTIYDIGIEYHAYFEPNITNSKALIEVFELAEQLYDNGMEFIQLNFDYKIELTKEAYLQCLSPSRLEKIEYLKILNFEPEVNRMKRSKAANLLSTLFKLKVENKYILFTSDVEKLTFERMRDRHAEIFQDSTNVLCQVPHHGSLNNHEPIFWNSIIRNDSSRAIISAGRHKSYNHPDFSVIRDFTDIGYAVDCTNVINGMETYVEMLKSKSLVLDTGSTIAEEYYCTGDKEFEFYGSA